MIAAAVVVAGCSSSGDSSTTTEGSASSNAPTTEAGLTGEGLALGLLAPSPGLLGTLVEGQQRGADLAVSDVNDGGGVLAGPLTVVTSAAEPGAAPADNVQAAIDAGAKALIGPVGSSGGIEVRDKVASSGSAICSASATVPGLTLGQDPMSLFRTATPDDITATYLAGQVINRRDAAAPGAPWKVAIVARADDYGQSVGNTLAAVLQSAGLVPSVVGYNPRRVTFASTAASVAAIKPDVTILVTYEEGGNLLSSLVKAGLDPKTMVGLDAFFAPRIADIATAGSDATVVDGFTMLGSMGNKAFLDRLIGADPNGQVANAPQAYDCAIVMALATAAVDAGSSPNLPQAAIDVTGDGITCTTYDDCLTKLNAGDDINYDGVSGQIALDANGDPTFARFTSANLEGGKISNIQSADTDVTVLRRQFEAYASAHLNTKIQQALTFLGFYTGPIDGLDSPEFRAAIAAFQTSVGLPPTGVWHAATDAAMRAALGEYATALMDSTKEMQRLLTELGVYSGPIDGIWTQEVTDAVKALQRELGVPETGVLDAATVQAAYARGAANATPTTTAPPPATTTPPPATTAPVTTAPATTAPATTTPPTTAPPAPETTAPPATTVPPVDPSLPTLSEALATTPAHSDFLRLLVAAGFEEDLIRPDSYTMFVPTNDALQQAGYDVNEIIAGLQTDPDQVAVLNKLLLDTIALGRLEIAQLTNPQLMLSGNSLEVINANDGTPVTIGGATITGQPVLALNGIIHELGALRPR